MKNSYLVILFLTFSFLSSGQTNIPKSDTLLYSFKTSSGKLMTLCKSRSNNSVCYRFGSAKKTELEYCTNKQNKIYYSFYLRGGGTTNEGMDLNYVYFTNDNFQYIIFDTYYAVENKQATGLKVIDLKTKKETIIKADKKTIKGNLIQFRDNQLLEAGEEMFD